MEIVDWKQILGFYRGRRILITGHTGFKGAWMSLLLHRLGASVSGYALDPPTKPNLFGISGLAEIIHSIRGDIRDYSGLSHAISEVNPDIVIHMAAQALVRESYRTPLETLETNIMGTANLLEALRHNPGTRVMLNVTSDKCYENKEWPWGYREYESLGGHDPYSASKGCSEIITSAYRRSFFSGALQNSPAAIATVRAGNVIGGGDWAADRLIPDIMRSLMTGDRIIVRYPDAIRPWQHVLEPLSAYLLLCYRLYHDGPSFSEAWNIGPDSRSARSVEWITNYICKGWGEGASWERAAIEQPHEAGYLKLDSSKAIERLGWLPAWTLEKSLDSVVGWYQAYNRGDRMAEICYRQMDDYFSNHSYEFS